MTSAADDGSRAPIDGKVFVGVSNSAAGDVDASTRFTYHQDGAVVWAEYAGGQVRRGHLIGSRQGEGLAFRYVHLDTAGQAASGRCTSQIILLPDGRIRLDDDWAWESRAGSGRSVVEELDIT